MKILSVHAHYDDFEFTAGGTFELWRRRTDPGHRARVVVCTDGSAGHHQRSRPETAALRLEEQQAAAVVGGWELEVLRDPGGSLFREACLQVTPDLLASLWHSIRAFEPDYLFCPPLARDPLAGIHNDHETVAEAVRRVAYMLNVPHAFTPEFPDPDPDPQPRRVPVILNVYDGYMFGANAWDLAVDVAPAFDTIAAMSWCHQSQIREWLPWVGRHRMSPPANPSEWAEELHRRFARQAGDLGVPVDRRVEVFTVTAWGEVPSVEQLRRDFPGLAEDLVDFRTLTTRLRRWRGER